MPALECGRLNYYPSKDAILIGVLNELERHESPRIIPLIKIATVIVNADEAKRATLDVLVVMVEGAVHQPEMCRLLAALQSEALNPSHPAHDWWKKRQKTIAHFLEKLIGRFVADPQSRARFLASTTNGLNLHWLRSDQDLDYVAQWKSALTLLLPELATPGPALRAPQRPPERERLRQDRLRDATHPARTIGLCLCRCTVWVR